MDIDRVSRAMHTIVNQAQDRHANMPNLGYALVAEILSLRDALRQAGEEPNLDKARAIADAALRQEGQR
jgi:hypothetical protein